MKHLHLTRVLAFALALVLLLGCTACGKKTTDDTGDTVGQKDTQTTVELDGKFTLNYSASAGMNPYKTQNSDNLAVCGLVYETLTELTDAFEAGPGLFTEWSSDDGETWTFTVAAGRTFHDGHALTAQDAAYSIQTAMASDLYSGRLNAVKDVKDSDARAREHAVSRAAEHPGHRKQRGRQHLPQRHGAVSVCVRSPEPHGLFRPPGRGQSARRHGLSHGVQVGRGDRLRV